MNYLEKYLKYKNKYLTLKKQFGGVGEIFPRHAAKQYKLDDNEYPVVSKVIPIVKENLLQNIDNATKFCSSILKKDITDEILRKYAGRIIFLYSDKISTDYENNDKLIHALIVTDANSVNLVIQILQNPEFSYNLTEMNNIIGTFYQIVKPEDIEKQIQLFLTLGFLFSYYPIDIYGFIHEYFNIIFIGHLGDYKFTYTYSEFIEKYFKPFINKIRSYNPDRKTTYIGKLIIEYLHWFTYDLNYIDNLKLFKFKAEQQNPLKLKIID